MVRPATSDDIPRMVELGELFFNEAGLNRLFPYDPVSAAQTFAGMIDNLDAAVFLLESDSRVVGGIGGLISPHYCNYAVRVMSEFFWWVEPASRGSQDAVRLAVVMETWARRRGAAVGDWAALKSSPPSVDRFYQKRGYNPAETHYVGGL